MDPVRGGFSSVLALDFAPQRAHPHRHREQYASEAGAQFDRAHGAFVFPAALHGRHDNHRLAVLYRLHSPQRAILECRRPGAMAGEISRSGLFFSAVLAGNFRADQAHRRHARNDPRPVRERAPSGGDRGGRIDPSDQGRRREDGGQAMTAFLIHNMAPLMFASLIVVLLIGYPAAFSLAAVGLIYGLIGIGLGLFHPDFLQALPERVYGIMSNDTLLAIPFFTFMGLILERSGMAEDLLDTIGQLFGTIRGGLAYAVVFVGALLAATTGVVAASVLAMGLISLPVMMRYGYSKRLASGVIAASGTLAQIIPPSLVLIVLADQMGASVGDLYEGAFIPGLSLAAL